MKKILNLDFNFKTLGGKDLLGINEIGLKARIEPAYKFISESLYCNSRFNLKIALICQKLYKNKEIELDEKDLILFEKEVKKLNFSNSIIVQVLNAIKNAKEIKTKEENV